MEQHNPFAPPKAEVADAVAPPTPIELASRTRRFVNMLIDTVGQFVLALVLMTIAFIVYPPLATDGFMEQGGLLGSYLLGGIIMLLYYVPSEALFGRTLGKLITGTRVVTQSGGTPSFMQILGRTAARLIPFEAITFLRSTRVGAHDSLSGTRLVRNAYGQR